MSFEFTENVSLSFPHINKEILDSFVESEGIATNNKLVTEVAAIHEGLTANYNHYSAAELAASLNSWVEPYPKPILSNHDPESEPMGRVMAARMDSEDDGTPFTRLQIAVLDPAAIAKVTDERYITGSVGGKATTALCSICNTDWAKPSESLPCKHKRGSIYGGKLAVLNLGGLSWKEYSFVNVPADSQSGVRPPASGEGGEWTKSARLFSVNMSKESILELNESEKPTDILQAMKKKDAHFTYMNVKGTFLTATAYDYKENIDTNITFDESIATIDNELGTKPPAHKSDEVKASEEIVMSTEEKTEDFLSIVQSLSDDLAASPEVATEDETASTEIASETDTADKGSDELSESSDEETAPESKEIETKEGSEKEESTEEVEEQLSETTNSTEEQATETESTEETQETAPDAKDLTIEALTQENDKLKKALHFMLAERVVDSKITLGMVESADRAEALKEHSTRTASSLADSIRDLEKVSVSTHLSFAKESAATIVPKTHAVEEADNDRVIEEAEEGTVSHEIEISPAKKFEDIMVNKLMNRTSS